jgi:radical SAM superfamily enzyme
MGEDLYFCLKAYHAGVEIWVDWGIRCAHYKTMELSAEFGLDLETGEGWVRR